jgi:hypothetical protein
MKHSDTLSGQYSDDQEPNKADYGNTQLIQKIRIDNTPFHAIGNEDDGYFIAFGHHKVTETYKVENKQESFQNILEYEQWNIIPQLCLIMDEVKLRFENIDFTNQENKEGN